MRNKKNSGFTLIEMMVSVALFAVIMAIGAASILSIINGNKKAEALSSVVNNLNFAIDSLTRDIKTGSGYVCGAGGDCTTGGTSISFNSVLNNGYVTYTFVPPVPSNGTVGYITRSITCPTGSPNGCVATTNPENISSNEVNITNLAFYVSGAAQSEEGTAQPKVLIVIQGMAGTSKTASPFNIETLVSQRSLNF